MSTGTLERPTPPPPPATNAVSAYEQAIHAALERTTWSVQLVDWLTNTLLLLAGVCAFCLALAFVDWIVGLSVLARAAALLLLLGGIGWFIYRRIVPLVLMRINPAYAARVIEQDRPTLKNSLINFLLLRDQPQAVHRAVYQALQERAAADLTHVEVDDAVDRQPLTRSATLFGGLFVAFLLCLFFLPANPLTTLARVLAPWSDIQRPSRVDIADVQPGDTEHYSGRPLFVSAQIAGLEEDERARVIFSTGDQRFVDQAVEMRFDEPSGRWVAELPPSDADDAIGLQADTVYHVVAGDAASDSYSVLVSDAPSINIERLVLDPPKYTGEPQLVQEEGKIDALPEGTRVTVHLVANQPIVRGMVEFSPLGPVRFLEKSDSVSLEVDGKDPRKATAQFFLRTRMDEGVRRPLHDGYRVRFWNERGDANESPIEYPIAVLPDPPPRVSFIRPPRQEVEVLVDEPLMIDVSAIDPKYGLKQVRLLGVHQGRTELAIDLFQHPAGETRQVRPASFRFVPAEHGLEVGDVILLRARATDNRGGEANVTETEAKTIRVVAPDPPDSQPDRPQEPNPGEPNPDNPEPNQPGEPRAQEQPRNPGDKPSPDERPRDPDAASEPRDSQPGDRPPQPRDGQSGGSDSGDGGQPQGGGESGSGEPAGGKPQEAPGDSGMGSGQSEGEPADSNQGGGQSSSAAPNGGESGDFNPSAGAPSGGQSGEQQPLTPEQLDKLKQFQNTLDDILGKNPQQQAGGGQANPAGQQPENSQSNPRQGGDAKPAPPDDEVVREIENLVRDMAKAEGRDPEQAVEEFREQARQAQQQRGGGQSGQPQQSPPTPSGQQQPSSGGNLPQEKLAEGANRSGELTPEQKQQMLDAIQQAQDSLQQQPGDESRQRPSSGGSQSAPVDREGREDGEVVERIQDFVNELAQREGKTPEQLLEELREQRGDSSGGGQRQPPQEPAGGQQPKQSGAESQNDGGPGEQPQSSPSGGESGSPQGGTKPRPEQPHGGGQKQPQQPSGGGMGENDQSGAGQQNQEGSAGATESQQKNQQQQSGANSGGGQQQQNQNQQSPGSGKKSSKSQGEGGDRKGGGDSGGGQSAKQPGNDSAGSSSAGDSGSGQAQQPGEGETGDRPGQSQMAPGETGNPAQEQGPGGQQVDGQGSQPGGQSSQQGANNGGGQGGGSQSNRPNQQLTPDQQQRLDQLQAAAKAAQEMLGKQNPQDGQAQSGDNAEQGAGGNRPGGEQGAKPPSAEEIAQRLQDLEQQIRDQAQAEGRDPEQAAAEFQDKLRQAAEQAQARRQQAANGEGPSGGGAGSGESTPPPGKFVETREEANLDYAREATKLALEYLRHQEDADPELLRRLGWEDDPEALDRFAERWSERFNAADEAEAPEIRRELNEALKSLGLTPGESRVRAIGAEKDDIRGRDTGSSRPPAEYEKYYRAYNRATRRLQGQ